MNFKSILIGLALALFISVFTYFNDAVVRGTLLIGNFLPIGIFGLVVLLLLFINPIVSGLMEKWSLRPKELAIATAFGLAACGWPGSNFYRTAVTITAMPTHLEQTETAWRSQNVMSYVPGGSPLLAQGQVSDWRALAQKIVAAEEHGQRVAGRIAEKCEPHQLLTFAAAAREAMVQPGQMNAMTRALNQIIESPDFYESTVFADIELTSRARALLDRGPEELTELQLARLNRELLVSAFPDLVLPPPEGEGLLLSMDKEGREVVDTLLEGRPPPAAPWSLRELPWGAWWPNIRLWGGLALGLGVASLCMALIVHPQWYKRELLPYPVARFMEEATARERGAWLPIVARNKFFWIALGVVFGLRLLNGLSAWFPGVPEFPLSYDFGALRELFPNARRVPQTWGVWTVYVSPTVIAFAFFLSTKVAFSLGISNIAWAAFGAILIAQGEPITYAYIGGEKINMLRFGSYLGMALMMAYTGRRYYANVVSSTFGFARAKETPAYAVWAGRGLVASFVLTVYLLSTAGLPLFWGAIVVLLMLLMFVVLSRIVSETGAFFLQPYWLPVGVITALFGVDALGPTNYLVLALASIMLVGDPRTTVMPFLSTGLRLGEETGKSHPTRLAPWLLAIVVGGFIVAGATTMYLQHNRGINIHDGWARRSLPSMPFAEAARHTSDMSARGVLVESTTQSTFERLSLFSPGDGAYFWMFLGIGFVLVAAFARLRLSWWPIHPVLFLVWATYPIQHFSSAFLIGWAIKAAVVKTTGAKGYHAVKPIMIGLIAGDLLGGLLWITISVVYFYFTGERPTVYSIFPG